MLQNFLRLNGRMGVQGWNRGSLNLASSAWWITLLKAGRGLHGGAEGAECLSIAKVPVPPGSVVPRWDGPKSPPLRRLGRAQSHLRVKVRPNSTPRRVREAELATPLTRPSVTGALPHAPFSAGRRALQRIYLGWPGWGGGLQSIHFRRFPFPREVFRQMER